MNYTYVFSFPPFSKQPSGALLGFAFTNKIDCDWLRMQASPVFTFANQAGLDMLETTLVALQDIMLDKILDEAGRKILCSEFSKIMQQVIMMHHVLFSNHRLTKSHTSPILKFDVKLYYNISSLSFFNCRALRICQQGYAHPAWAGLCLMSRPLHGKSWTMRTPITAWLSCL